MCYLEDVRSLKEQKAFQEQGFLNNGFKLLTKICKRYYVDVGLLVVSKFQNKPKLALIN